jgi:AraC-like DNA-binding protein
MRRRAPEVRDVRFHNPRLSRVGVEVLGLAELRRRTGAALNLPERPDFYLLLVVRSGAGRHMVDFLEYALKAGDVLLVRPGQVQQWRLEGSLDGELVLVSPEALAPFIARAEADMRLLALEAWPARIRPSASAFAQTLAGVDRLRSDILRFDGSPLEAAIIWHELLALLLRMAREQGAAGAAPVSAGGEVHRLFVQEMERSLRARTTVAELARRLGYSESTLARACLAATGRTAKEALDERVALEAKRLLVHSRASVTAISHQLGFSEPTNFVKFFRRVTGTSPLAFRAAHI